VSQNHSISRNVPLTEHLRRWWADGIYFNVRLDEERSCVLVLMGALEDGTTELMAVGDGYRESAQSCRELLQQLKHQA
jgi:putative transposase